MTNEDSNCRRKEPRFKASEDKKLLCQVFVDVNEPVQGHVLDVSSNGLRMFCEGDFQSGSAFLTELKTDVLHGVFPGIVRRVTPWVGGGCVLGCQLLETIPDEVLEELARQHIVNRRQDERVEWNQPAKMTFQLGPGEIDVTIKDCSSGGLRLVSTDRVPDDTCVRLKLPGNAENPVTIEARTVWQTQIEEGWSVGLSFIRREVPESVVQILCSQKAEPESRNEGLDLRRAAVVTAAVATFVFAMLRMMAN